MSEKKQILKVTYSRILEKFWAYYILVLLFSIEVWILASLSGMFVFFCIAIPLQALILKITSPETIVGIDSISSISSKGIQTTIMFAEILEFKEYWINGFRGIDIRDINGIKIRIPEQTTGYEQLFRRVEEIVIHNQSLEVTQLADARSAPQL